MSRQVHTFLEGQCNLPAILPNVLGGAAARDDADAVVERPADHDGERGDSVLSSELGPDSIGNNSL